LIKSIEKIVKLKMINKRKGRNKIRNLLEKKRKMTSWIINIIMRKKDYIIEMKRIKNKKINLMKILNLIKN
jgi:hypothetical protein